MKTLSPRLTSPLGRLQPTSMDMEEVKRKGWQKQNILVVCADDKRLDFVEKKLVRRLGDRLYGGSACD